MACESGAVGISKGIIVNGKAKVETGPLVGYDDHICKVDVRSRKATLKFGDRKVIFALVITERITERS